MRKWKDEIYFGDMWKFFDKNKENYFYNAHPIIAVAIVIEAT